MKKQDWQIGDIILDQYEVRGILGQGGMGIVYKMYHRAWNTYLAVKSPRPEILAQKHGEENFMREAETWVKLERHPHIVRCDFVKVLGGIPRVFAEYIDGGSLAHWIHRRKLYEGDPVRVLEHILDLSIQVAWGLQAAHEQGLVHQDMKPSNVMLTRHAVAKVTDFGLAKARVLAGEQCLQEGEIHQSILVSSRGMTPAYCSPEQTMGQALSRKTDIWSWAVSVLEMFVGNVTWGLGVRAPEALESGEKQYPEIPVIPTEVANVLRKCFQRQPEMRPATMLEVARELQAIYAHLIGRPYSREAPQPVKVSKSALMNRGLSLRALGKRDEALLAYDQAIALDPSNASIYYDKGATLQALGRRAEALLAYEQAIALHPAHAIAYYSKGNALRALGRLEEALTAYEQAIILDPTHIGVYHNKGIALLALGRQKEALTAYEQAIKLNPASVLDYIHKGRALVALERREEALLAYDQAIALDPNNAFAYGFKGETLRELGRLEEAVAVYDQAIALNSMHVDAQRIKAVLLRELKQITEAKKEST